MREREREREGDGDAYICIGPAIFCIPALVSYPILSCPIRSYPMSRQSPDPNITVCSIVVVIKDFVERADSRDLHKLLKDSQTNQHPKQIGSHIPLHHLIQYIYLCIYMYVCVFL